MVRLPRSKLWRAVLVGAGVLMVAIVLGLLVALSQGRPAALAPPPSALQPAALRSPYREATFTLWFLERPLFWAERQPYTPEPEAPPPIAQREPPGARALDDVTLVGVFASGASAGVIVKIRGERRRMLRGEEIQGWELRELQGQTATFVRSLGAGKAPAEQRLRLVPTAPPPLAEDEVTGGDTLQENNDGAAAGDAVLDKTKE